MTLNDVIAVLKNIFVTLNALIAIRLANFIYTLAERTKNAISECQYCQRAVLKANKIYLLAIVLPQ